MNNSSIETITAVETKKRMVSLDALRGFNMFWIIGARALAGGLAGLNLAGISVLTGQLYHSKWDGFTFYDLIFPLFIFITGVSLVLSLQKRRERRDNPKVILQYVLKRTVVLFLLGMVYNVFDSPGFLLGGVRVMGVLQRVALCYFFASLLVLYVKPKTFPFIIAGLLAGYWALMRFVPVPGFGAGIWTEEGNLAHYVDSLLLPGRLYYGSWDPEGLFSTIPAIATCLLGVLSGVWLRTVKWRGRVITARQRPQFLFLAGFVLVLLGLLAHPFFPINKKLWTSSFVLLTGGLSAMALAAFHWLIDLRGCRLWAFPFVVIGMNSIFIYLAAGLLPFDKVAQWLTGGAVFAFVGSGQTLLAALVQLGLEVTLLWWMYKRKTFLRI